MRGTRTVKTITRIMGAFSVAAISLAASSASVAQDSVRATDAEMFPTDVSYDPRIPTPESVLGHELGAAPVRHHKLVEYITTVAEMSNRLSVEVIGYTHERRPILFVVATSPANQARIDDIRAQHVALTEPATDQQVAETMPVVTWLNYGVHGAEASGMDASLPTVYYLAAAQGAKVDALLDNSVILITAIFNPDGHSKRVHWFDTYGARTPIADPQHIEHNYQWQLARTNHYHFDLNRQWLSITQPESRAWMKKWHEWRPNLSVDYHEMRGDRTYYFSPGIPTRINPLIPGEADGLLAEVVSSSEAFLDSESRLYFHAESYDNFFLGKGAGLPAVNGGLGLLYEAGTARGIELETPHGLRTYRENIRKHFRTSLGSAEGALNMRLRLLDYQKRFYDGASDAARDDSVKAYVFDAPDDAARLYHFVDLLNYHRIRTFELARDITVNGESYTAGQAMLVPMDQPQYRMIRTLFDTFLEFEDASFYDVSAWTVPLSFNLDYEALSGRNFRSDMLGSEASLAMPVADAPDTADYAYLFEWSGYYAPRALQRVLGTGLRASVAGRPFVAETSRGPFSFKRGSILVPFDRQEQSRQEIAAVMRAIAADDGIFVHAVSSGRSAVGTAAPDLGGPTFTPLTEPKILLVTGRDADLYNVGEAWHLMDYRMHMPVTMRERERLGDIDWNGYTHVIFPGGDYDKFAPEYAGTMRRWVREGGTVIGMRQASPWLRDNVLDYSSSGDSEKSAAGELDTESGHEPLPGEGEETARVDYEERKARDAVDVIGGAIFAGDLDTTHPLGFGYGRRQVALQKNTREVMTPPENPYATVIAYEVPPVLSGYASEANQQALSGSAALIAERKGRGSVVLFADDPNFRAIFYGTNKLFLNALFFSKAFEAPAAD